MARALWACTFCLLLPSSLFAQFQTHVDYPVGSSPFSVAVGDFNGDKKPDLVVANSDDNTVSILLGHGDGTFLPQVKYVTGNRPTTVAAADFNGDRQLDLVVTAANDSAVSVLLGNGDGTFQGQVEYPVELNDQYLAVADFNGDGRPDIATSNYGADYFGGSVSVLLGVGNGTFLPQATYAAGVNPFGIMAADFNHDGKMDLAVSDNNGWFGVSILLGNGDGSFQSPGWYATGRNPRMGAIGDFSADGNLDLAVGNCIDNSLSVLMGDGQGHFASPLNFATGDTVQSVASGDFDRDGKIDLVTPGQTSNGVSVLLGNGDGTFQSPAFYAAGSTPFGVAVADLNGDGAPDVVITNFTGASVSVLLNSFHGTTVSLIASLNPAAPSQLVTYTAKVTSKNGDETGSVAFKDGQTTVATAGMTNHSATFSARYSTVGAHAMTAVYAGDSANTGSTSPVLVEYVRGATTTVITTSGSPSLVGQPVMLTATVSSRFGSIPDGALVTFYDGTVPMASAPQSAGTAQYTATALTARNHGIRATYAGTEVFKPSTGVIAQVVGKYSSAIAFTVSGNPSTYGKILTLTAAVTSAGPIPSGVVIFQDGGVGIGRATLNPDGSATFVKTNLTAGSHTLTATYNGDAATLASASAAVVERINPAITHTTILSSVNPSNVGQAVRFTAGVSSPTTTPTGSMTFMDGPLALATVSLSGTKASYSTTALRPGSHNITAVYNGTTNAAGSASPLFVQIVK